MWVGHSTNGLHHKIDIPDSWSGQCVLLVIFPGTGMGSAEPFARVSAVWGQHPRVRDDRLRFRGWLVIVEPNRLGCGAEWLTSCRTVTTSGHFVTL